MKDGQSIAVGTEYREVRDGITTDFLAERGGVTDDPSTTDIRIELTDSDSIDEIVLGFRKNGELHELAQLELPAEGVLKKR